jgi:hypothetical protein
MDTDLVTIKAAFAKLTHSELSALVWAANNFPQVTPGLLRWLEAACNWELHRRVGVEYELQSPEAVMPPGEAAASINATNAIKAMFGKGAGGVRALLDALIHVMHGTREDQLIFASSSTCVATPAITRPAA